MTLCNFKSAGSLTIDTESKIESKQEYGIEKVVFNSKDYNSIFQNRQIFDNYFDVVNFLDKDIKEMANQKRLPLIIKEHFYTFNKANLADHMEFENIKSQITDFNHIPSSQNLAKNIRTLDSNTELKVSKSNINIRTSKKKIIQEKDFEMELNDSEVMPQRHKSSLKIAKKNSNKEQIITISDEESASDCEDKEILHICFMLHGLEGTAYDMRNLRSSLQIYCPSLVFYISECNEKKTNESIEVLGNRFAKEVEEFIIKTQIDEEVRISFIGHSLGGLIIRAALPQLQNYSSCFYSYISISTPHLGSVGEKFWVNAGMKLLCKMKSNQSMREMCLEDQPVYLNKLSNIGRFENFKNVILIAMYDDGYTPYESALIVSNSKSKARDLMAGMAKNLYEKLNTQNVLKLGIFVPYLAKGVDMFVGRQAHVEILENNFLKHLIFSQLRDYL